MPGVPRRVEHRHEAAERVPVDDRSDDAERVAEGADVVGARLEAPVPRVAPVGTAVAAQIEVHDLCRLREPVEVGLEVRVVEAPRAAVEEHHGRSPP